VRQFCVGETLCLTSVIFVSGNMANTNVKHVNAGSASNAQIITIAILERVLKILKNCKI
jgi:hypothetical protein